MQAENTNDSSTPTGFGRARLALAISAGKLAGASERFFRIGGGTSLTGMIARRIDPNVLKSVVGASKAKKIVITGSNGKTTTARMTAAIADANGRRVSQNRTGSNLLQGVTSVAVNFADLFGRLDRGYAKGAMMRGVEIHTQTEVTGILIENGRIKSVETNRGTVHCNKAMQAVAGSSSLVAKLAGFRLPIRTIPLQACVSVPLKPFLDQIVVSGSLHIYISQTPRGELVMGGSTDPYGLYSTRSTLDFKEGLLGHMLELFPFLDNVTVLRQWAGMADMTPDFSPVMGLTPVENYYIDAGWGTWGFKATPVCGKRMAETVATGKAPAILEPFRLDRFVDFAQVGEKGAASVGH